MLCILNKISYHIVEIIILIDDNVFLSQIQKILYKFNDYKIIDRINIKRCRVILNTIQPAIYAKGGCDFDYYIINESIQDKPKYITKDSNVHIWVGMKMCQIYRMHRFAISRKNKLPSIVGYIPFTRSWGYDKTYHRKSDYPSRIINGHGFWNMQWHEHGYYYRRYDLPHYIDSSGNRIWYNDKDRLLKYNDIIKEYI